MKTKIKRIIGFIIMCALAVSCFTVTVSAEDTPDPIDMGDLWSVYNDPCNNRNSDANRTLTSGMQVNEQSQSIGWGDGYGYSRNTSFNIGDELGITYHIPDNRIYGAIIRAFYPDEPTFYWIKFFGSHDGESWTEITDKFTYQVGNQSTGSQMDWYERLFYSNNLEGYEYLKLRLTNTDCNANRVWRLHVDNVKIWYGNSTYSDMPVRIMGESDTDECNNLNRLHSSSNKSGLKIMGDNVLANHKDTGRVAVTDTNATMVYEVSKDSLAGFCVWANVESDTDEHPTFYVSKDGESYEEIAVLFETKEPDTDGGKYERIYYTSDVPGGMKFVKISFMSAPSSIQLGQSAIITSKLAYTVLEKGTEAVDGITRVYATVTNRQDTKAPVTLVALADNGEKDIIRTKRMILDSYKTDTVKLDLPFETDDVEIFICDSIDEFHDIISYPYDLYDVNISFEVNEARVRTAGMVKGTGEKYLFLLIHEAGIEKDVLESETLDEDTLVYLKHIDSFNSRTGKFSESFDIPEFVRPGKYVYKVAVSGSSTVLSDELLIARAEEKESVIAKINNPDTDLLTLMGGDDTDDVRLLEVLGVNMDGYAELSPYAKEVVVSKIMAASQGEALSETSIDNIINEIIFIERLKDAENTKIESIFDDITTVRPDITEDEYYKEYLSFEGEYKERIYNLIFKNKNYANMDDLLENFIDFVIFQKFNCASYDRIDELLEEYKDKIMTSGETLYKKYTSSISKSVRALVNKEMINQNYETYQQIYDKFEAAMKEKASGSTGGSTGGAIGGSAGGSTGSGSLKGGSLGSSIGIPSDVSQSVAETELKPEKIIFGDIADVEWAKEAIEYLSEDGIILGDGDGNFRPNDFVKREEFVKMVILAFDIKADKETELSFEDINKTAWYYDYVKTAYTLGVIKGYGDNFGVGDYIQRQDMAVIINNCLKKFDLNKDKGVADKDFADKNNIAEYALEGVDALADLGILNGNERNEFNPEGNTTRAEAAKVLYTALMLMKGAMK